MKYHKFYYFMILVLLASTINAQVSKKTIVEQFTNTNCSVCASRNPGFYSNYQQQSNTIHLAVFPSAPYASCLLSQQNRIDSDARTNYYGVYGSTPRLVINGNVILSAANYADTGIFSPYKNLSTPASIRIEQTKYDGDSILSKIIIKTEAAHTLGSLSLFVGLAEDTIFYTGGNGESMHYNVFRKALSAAIGDAFTLPTAVGDSVVLIYKSTSNTVWNFARIYTVAILQESSSRNLVQSEAYDLRNQPSVPAALSDISQSGIVSVYPNPTHEVLTISLNDITSTTVAIINLQGETVLEQKQTSKEFELHLSDLAAGSYIVKIITPMGLLSKSFIKL